MRIGIAQINTVAGAFDQTVERMVAQSQRAAEQGVELLVFPLAALAGTGMVPYADRVSFVRDISDAVMELMDRLACPSIVPVPLDLGDEQATYDALLFDHDEIRPLRSTFAPLLAASDTPQDEPMVRAAESIPTFELGGLRMALAFSHADLDELSDGDYHLDAALFVSGYPFAMDDPSSVMAADLGHGRFPADAEALDAWLVGVASVGCYGDEVFSGSSFVLAPTGDLVASAPAFEEALLVSEVGGSFEGQPQSPLTLEDFDSPFFLWQAVSLGIHDSVTKQGYTEVALCLDGSLRSSVLAALASDALGPTHVHVLVGTAAGAHAASCRELTRRLRVDQVDAPAPVQGLDPADLDELHLAQLARSHGALVLSSIDKTGLALGLSVGRVSAATLCPLGDVYRSDVLDMAHVRNTISPLFRRVALGEADAFELAMPDGTTRRMATEADITAVDEILLGYIEYDRSLADLSDGGESNALLVDAVLRAERATEVFRRATPPVLAMSTHTLDDARFPVGVRWDDTHFDSFESIFESFDLDLPWAGEKAPQSGVPSEGGTNGIDVEGTLAMLRDLAEQGGFVPGELPIGLQGIPGEGQRPEGADGLAWMAPFSEN